MHFWWGSDLSGEKMTKHGQKELKGRGCVLFFLQTINTTEVHPPSLRMHKGTLQTTY